MSKSPIVKASDGSTHWIDKPGDRYAATGVDRNGRRFRIESASWSYIRGINLWRGSKWLLRDGRRFCVGRVVN